MFYSENKNDPRMSHSGFQYLELKKKRKTSKRRFRRDQWIKVKRSTMS
jgi:hypothetical protein